MGRDGWHGLNGGFDGRRLSSDGLGCLVNKLSRLLYGDPLKLIAVFWLLLCSGRHHWGTDLYRTIRTDGLREHANEQKCWLTRVHGHRMNAWGWIWFCKESKLADILTCWITSGYSMGSLSAMSAKPPIPAKTCKGDWIGLVSRRVSSTVASKLSSPGVIGSSSGQPLSISQWSTGKEQKGKHHSICRQ